MPGEIPHCARPKDCEAFLQLVAKRPIVEAQVQLSRALEAELDSELHRSVTREVICQILDRLAPLAGVERSGFINRLIRELEFRASALDNPIIDDPGMLSIVPIPFPSAEEDLARQISAPDTPVLAKQLKQAMTEERRAIALGEHPTAISVGKVL